MKQELIDLGHYKLPVVVDENERYYPIRFTFEKVLLRARSSSNNILKNSKYKPFTKMMLVNFDHVKAGIQNTNCISEIGLKEVLLGTEIGRLSVESRKIQNKLMGFLGLELLTERDLIIDTLIEGYLNEHLKEVREVIIKTIVDNPKVTFQLCVQCNKYYPLIQPFFHPDARTPNGYLRICNQCYRGRDLTKKHIKRNVTHEVNSIEEYTNYIHNTVDIIPNSIENKESYKEILKHLYDCGSITKENTNVWLIRDQFRLPNMNKYFTTKSLYWEFLGKRFEDVKDEFDKYETHIEDCIIQNLHKLESGMRYIDRQYEIEGGAVDIIARDKNNKLCVIEIKIVDNNLKLIWQSSYYQSQFEESVRMITITPDYTDRIYAALNNIKNVEVVQYYYDENREINFRWYKPNGEFKIKFKYDKSKII